MEVTERRGPSEPHPPRLALLFEGPRQPFVVPLLRGQPMVVGRRAPADIVVDDASLSRLHARFLWQDDGVWLEDLGSTNGSTANDRPVTRALLVPGDTVKLGAVPVRVHALHAPAGSEPILQTEDFEEHLRQGIDEQPTRPVTLALVADAQRRPMDAWVPGFRIALGGDEHCGLHAAGLAVADLQRNDLKARLAVAVRRDDLRIGLVHYPTDADSADELIARAHRLLELATSSEPLVTPEHYPHDEGASQVVASPRMQQVHAQVARVASTRAPVLLIGETGVGKELVARAIHERSDRREGPMKALNCGAIPGTLQESLLFGHERGAFTGADKRTPGIFEQAQGGTVFLDEIGELPSQTQAALLRTLETGRVVRLGSTQETVVDVRIVSATHRNLDAMVQQGQFREDLLYRLNTVTIPVPPLRERTEEIQPLVQLFLRHASESGGTGRIVSDRAMRALESYSWPGNVRELRNVVERAVIMALRHEIDVGDLPPSVVGQPNVSSVPSEPSGVGSLRDQLKAFESRLIVEALASCAYNKTRAAEHLGIPVRTLSHKIQSLGLKAKITEHKGE